MWFSSGLRPEPARDDWPLSLTRPFPRARVVAHCNCVRARPRMCRAVPVARSATHTPSRAHQPQPHAVLLPLLAHAFPSCSQVLFLPSLCSLGNVPLPLPVTPQGPSFHRSSLVCLALSPRGHTPLQNQSCRITTNEFFQLSRLGATFKNIKKKIHVTKSLASRAFESSGMRSRYKISRDIAALNALASGRGQAAGPTWDARGCARPACSRGGACPTASLFQ